MTRWTVTLILTAILVSIVAHGQTDSAKTQEISIGISIIPPLCPGFGNTSSGRMPSIKLNRIMKYKTMPTPYSVPINVNYRFEKWNGKKINLSFIAVIPTNSYCDLSYYAISYGTNLAKLNKKGTFLLNGDLLIGYLKYTNWSLPGMFTSPKSYEGADLLLAGFNIGLRAQYRLTKRLFLENEIHMFTYCAYGNLYVYPNEIIKGGKAGITFSKFLSFNLGYKF